MNLALFLHPGMGKLAAAVSVAGRPLQTPLPQTSTQKNKNWNTAQSRLWVKSLHAIFKSNLWPIHWDIFVTEGEGKSQDAEGAEMVQSTEGVIEITAFYFSLYD